MRLYARQASPANYILAGTGSTWLFKSYRITAEKFIADSFSKAPGSRLYKTGDLARWLPDGNMEFLAGWTSSKIAWLPY
jgi:hypothetical protein